MDDQKVKPKIETTSDLFELLKGVYGHNDTAQLDTKNLRYVLYARKSTTDEERQERSIPDQIKDCVDKVILPNNLNLVGSPLQEKGSAKEPDIRPVFRQMIEDIKSGKIDGIISWHPDRLSRNMKEAGEIIDLLDKGILKDLQFATSTFENSPTGKMLLGISFVLSKQYSEHLSENIKRGNRRITEDGLFIGDMKHGYFIRDGRLFPDDHFILIKAAFQKRLDGETQENIAKTLNASSYRVRKKNKEPSLYRWDKDSVSKMLKDPVYAGVLKYGKNLVNLEEHYDFQPIVSVEEFMQINKVNDLRSSKILSSMLVRNDRDTLADLLRNKVICGFCNKTFSSGITTKELKAGTRYYYFYRCETDDCEFKNKGVRAKKIIEFAIDYLEQHHFTTESNYETFVADARAYVKTQNREVSSDIARLSKQIGNKDEEYKRAKNLIAGSPELKRHYDLDQIVAEKKELSSDLDKLKKQRTDLKQSIFTYEEYLELFGSIGVILRSTQDMNKLDQTLRKFFSNFTVKATGSGNQQRCDITVKLNEPFAGFVETGNFDHGRGDRT